MALKLRVATLRNKKSIFPSHTLPRFHKYGLLPPKTNPRKQSLSSLSQRKIESQPGTHAGNRRTDTQPRSGGGGLGEAAPMAQRALFTRRDEPGAAGRAGGAAQPGPALLPPRLGFHLTLTAFRFSSRSLDFLQKNSFGSGTFAPFHGALTLTTRPYNQRTR